MTHDVEVVEPLTTARFVDRAVERLQREYLAGTSRSRASLAHLRRSLGQPLGAVPEILELVVDPDAPLTGGPPTPDERAVAAALGLYALHQQSLSQPMHIRGERFGTALGGIARRGGEPVPGVTRRFQALGTAESWDEVLHHSRGLVQLLRGGRRGFDYGWFAQDLAQFVDPLRRDEVRLRWGRAFYRVTPTTEPTSTTSEEQ